MQYATFGDYKISRLSLGTVQLGMEYGISNHAGKPPRKASLELLQYATDAGINTLDTSPHYGNAEEIIGEFNGIRDKTLNVVTKFRISHDAAGNYAKAKDEVFRSVKTSLTSLKIHKIPVCLFHQQAGQPLQQMIELLERILTDLKKEELIDIGGISIFNPEDMHIALATDVICAMQVPLNVFDQQLIRETASGYLKNKLIFARSVFLQGLLLMHGNELPHHLKPAAPFLRRLNGLAEEAGMTTTELVFAFVRDIKEVSSVLIGALNLQQMKENLAMLHGKPLDESLKNSLMNNFAEVPAIVRSPWLWQVTH